MAEVFESVGVRCGVEGGVYFRSSSAVDRTLCREYWMISAKRKEKAESETSLLPLDNGLSTMLGTFLLIL
jgi:hypothetical protein